jgi:hypothetical protein
MSDKKNFSVLGKIDEKYIDEAADFSVEKEPLNKKDGGRVAVSAKRRIITALSTAAAILIIASGIFVGKNLLGAKNMAGDYMADNMTNGVEHENWTTQSPMPDIAEDLTQGDGNAEANDGAAEGAPDADVSDSDSTSDQESESDSESSSSNE